MTDELQRLAPILRARYGGSPGRNLYDLDVLDYLDAVERLMRSIERPPGVVEDGEEA